MPSSRRFVIEFWQEVLGIPLQGRLIHGTYPLKAGAMAVRNDSSPGLRFPDQLVYRGYSAPSRIECDVYDLEVVGSLPDVLQGTYYRASGDPQYPPLHGTDIFINGDGMIHMVRIGNGHADLKTRYVRTPKFLAERAERRALFGAYRNPYTDDPAVADVNRNTANTAMLWHAGKLFALKEAARPMQLDPETLETIGSYDFDGALTSETFTAHPKLDPDTGEVIAFGYNTHGRASNTIEIYWIAPDGTLTRTESFDAPYPSMVHDFHVSKSYIAFTICPMVNDWERVERGEAFFHWDNTLPTVVGVIPRSIGVAGLRWFPHPGASPVMQTHTFNAWEDGDVLHLDHFITESGWLSQFPDLRDPDAHEKPPFAERWTFDMSSDSNAFSINRIFNHIGEMPMVDPRRLMHRATNLYFGTINHVLGPMLEWGPKGPPFTCIGHYNDDTGETRYWYAGPDSAPEEPVFVPKGPGGADGDGWLLTIVGRRAENRTDLVVLDALDIAAGPVATIRFPCRVHEGFHGTWIPA
jgi:carotenoid cleavage dioxygenase-like enzyme